MTSAELSTGLSIHGITAVGLDEPAATGSAALAANSVVGGGCRADWHDTHATPTTNADTKLRLPRTSRSTGRISRIIPRSASRPENPTSRRSR